MLFCASVHAENAWVHVRGAWEPPAAAVETMKTGVEGFVRINTGTRKLRPWSEYVFQYQGQVDRGRRYVLVNALCRADADWPLQAQIVLRMEAGPCYFHLKFDPVEGTFYGFYM